MLDELRLLQRPIELIITSLGATCAFTYALGYRPVVNDAALTARLTEVASRTFGADMLEPLRPVMGGEDFSAYKQRAPGVFAFVGAGNVERGITAAHHHPRFVIDKASLDVGLRYLVAATVELLAG